MKRTLFALAVVACALGAYVALVQHVLTLWESPSRASWNPAFVVIPYAPTDYTIVCPGCCVQWNNDLLIPELSTVDLGSLTAAELPSPCPCPTACATTRPCRSEPSDTDNGPREAAR